MAQETQRRTIFKYPVTAKVNLIEVNSNPKILKFCVQNDVPTIWVEQDLYYTHKVEIKIEVEMTGISFLEKKGYEYIGTVLLQKETIVLHGYAVYVST